LPPLLRVLNFFAVELQGMQSSAEGIVESFVPGSTCDSPAFTSSAC
jgi:hypothetical protein